MAARTAPRQHAVFHTLRVSAVERLTDDAVTVTFDVPDDLGAAYRFAPGQHLTLRTTVDGEDIRRNYSICAPASSGVLRVAVKRIEEGVFSGYALDGLTAGDELEVMTPTGRFTTALDPSQARHYVAIAAGSGITPVLSLVSTVLEVEPASQVTLVYGNRTTASVMFLDELADLKDRYPDRFTLVHVLSREPVEVDLFHGRIDADKLRALFGTLLPPETVDEWFLCGPFEMVTQARDTLVAAGVDRDHVHAELFHVEDEPPVRAARNGAPVRRAGSGSEPTGDGPASEGPTSTVTVYLDGRASTFELAARGRSVLEATLAVRADAPFACKGGVCGTCRAKLVEGEVEMDRNYALERDELESGFVLACQSHPTTPTLVLDFDQ
ncbi:MAG: 1,2-phenylacetyl-CoA epoxidase subunit PaaE [Actinomycetes bacterium]